MNYMEQVAQMLGVELEEEFKLNDSDDYKYKITKDGMFMYSGFDSDWFSANHILLCILIGKYRIVKKPILDEAERRYLKNVIRPFKDKISCICKNQTVISKSEWIRLVLKSDLCIEFPCFENGTMYKGMEVGKKYTLEDLGL